MDDLAIMCDEVIEPCDEDVETKSNNETKVVPTNFNERKATCKNKILKLYLLFY